MNIYQTQTIETQVLSDTICDVCGRSCMNDHSINFEYATLHAEWGYGSGKDGTQWDCHICSDCADKIKDYIVSIGGDVITSYR